MIMLELGPLLTGLVLTGRVGGRMTAEIGTMRVTEQIDALETLPTIRSRSSSCRGCSRATSCCPSSSSSPTPPAC